MSKDGIEITITNYDSNVALAALEVLVKDRGFPDTATALLVGKTMRSLRVITELTEDARNLLIDHYAKRDEQDKPVSGTGPQSIKLEDPQAFVTEIKKLNKEQQTVTIWPIALAALGKDKLCNKCKRVTGIPTPEALAVLIELGILTQPTAKKSPDG